MDQRQIPTVRTTRPSGRQPPSGLTRTFLEWPAAASAIFLLSAACLLAGAWWVFEPLLGLADSLGERFSLTGTVQLYELTLLGAAVLLCRWQRGNPDAIGPAVLAACFLVGGAVTLDLVSIDSPWWTGCCGLAGLTLLIGRHRLLSTGVVGGFGSWLLVTLALLAAWNLLSPAALGLFAKYTDATAQALWLWLPGWWLVVLAGGLLLAGAVREFDPTTDRHRPFLCRAGMRWILALVVLACSLVHLDVQAYVHSISLVTADYLVPLALIVLVVGELRARTWGNHGGADLAELGIPAALALGVALVGSPSEVAAATPWAILATPGAVLAWLALTGLRLGLDRAQPHLVWASVGCALAAVLTWGAAPGIAQFNVTAALIALASTLVIYAWSARRPEVLALALVMTITLSLAHPPVVRFLHDHGLWAGGMALALDGLALLAVAIYWPVALTPAIRRLAAGLVTIGAVSVVPHTGDLGILAVGCMAAGLVLTLVAWRLRDWVLIAPPMAPALLALPELALRHRGWSAIIVAFALIGVALLVAHRRVHRDQRRTTMAVPTPVIC